MIVKMTPELQAKYYEYFKEIGEVVTKIGGENADLYAEVNSLPTYYRALDFIAQNGAGADNKKFFRIPLDEKPITIDLSTRKMNVKNSAYSESIGVVGDSNAEIIFFESDRFYDITDLALCNYILIQWSNDGGATYHQEYGILQDFTAEVRDPEDESIILEPAKVLFGWLVNKDVTAKNGKIRFNIRYCLTDENGDIVFDLNTEPAEVNILGSLAPVGDLLPAEPDKAEGIVFSRPIYGSIIDSMSGASPVIGENLVSGIYHLNKQYPETTGTYSMKVTATSPDGGKIVHEWYKDGALIYDDEGNKWSLEEYPATIAGSYWARVGNQTNSGTRTVITPTVHIPAASAITLNSQVMPVRAYAPNAESDKNKAPAAWIANLSVDVNNEDITKLKYPAVLQYQWYKSVGANDVVAEGVQTITEGQVTYAPIEGATSSAFVPGVNEEGRFMCEITNHLNNTASEPIRSAVSEVRAYPQNLDAPIIELVGKELVCHLQGNVPADLNEVRYQWNRSDIGPVSERNGGTKPAYDLGAYLLAEGTYAIQCYVSHVVFAGTTVEASSSTLESVSNSVIIKVSKNAQGNLVYEQV